MKNLQSGLFYSLTGVTAVTSLVSCSIKQKPVEQKPLNIVYIMTDDHTAQMMSCYDTRYMVNTRLTLPLALPMTTGTPSLIMPAFSLAIFVRVFPRYCMWSKLILVMTHKSG